MKQAAVLQHELAQCYGTMSYQKHGDLFLTDGCQLLAEDGECYWLFDMINSYQPRCRADPMLRDMQFWILKVAESKAELVCERDTGNVAFSQQIEYTDFPIQGETNIWVEWGSIDGVNEHYVAMLPSER